MPDAPFQARPDLHGSFGMSASTHWLASATAQSVLERGGNAFDAATAAAFVLHVVEPHLNGPGGDLVALVAPGGGAPRVLAGQGPAPAAATPELFLAAGLTDVPGAGALAAAVPGAVDAWLTLLRDHGTWELGAVLDYAIDYATHGHRLLASAAGVVASCAPLFRDHWPTSAELWLPDGEPPAPGSVVRNPVYADMLRRLVAAGDAADGEREGRIDGALAAWRSGFVATAIEEFVSSSTHRHSSGTDHRGVLTTADLASYATTYEQPAEVVFRGHVVHKAGRWSQGPVLLQALSVLDGFTDAELDLDTGAGVHRVAETLKLVMADREAWYGDDPERGLLTDLLDDGYARERRGLIGDEASLDLRPGRPGGRAPRLPALEQSAQEGMRVGAPSPSVGEPTVSSSGATRGDTCHLDVVDRWGNWVSATPSGGWLQSSPTIPALGFCLGTRLQMSWLDRDSRSALQPGRRPRTTLSPTLLSRGDEVVAALGTPGGDQQDQWQLLFLLRVLVGRMTPQQAIEAPAFHSTAFPASFWPRTWTPGGLVVEERWPNRVVAELRERGHRVTTAGAWSLGRLSAVTRDPATGMLGAAANPRGGQGYAVGR